MTIVTGHPAPPCDRCGRTLGSWRWRLPDATIVCGPCRQWKDTSHDHEEEAQQGQHHDAAQVDGQRSIFDALTDADD